MGRTGGGPRQTRLSHVERRAQIVECARRLFSTHPVASVSMEAVAREAGVTSALLYHYFDGKHKLYVAVVREMFRVTPPVPEYVAGVTHEWVSLPDDIVARIEGKSSVGRLGLIVHATAGFVDPGFAGTLTLEITNLTRIPIKLWPGLPICQLSFMALDQPAERPYGHPDLGSHYHGQVEATESRYEGRVRAR